MKKMDSTRRVIACLVVIFMSCCWGTYIGAQPGGCNNPLTGKGTLVDRYSGGLVSLLNTSPDYENAVDGDLTNYVEIGLTSVTGVGSVSLISVKDQNNVFPAGRRTGFVLEVTNTLNGLLGADVLNSLEIRTYLNNSLQEVAEVGGSGPPISLNLLSGSGNKRRIDFVSTESFDEVELVFTGIASSSLLSTFRIYYAYEEIDGCDYNCATALTTANFPGTTATTNCELFVITCLDPGFSAVSDVIDADTTDFASDAMLLLESNWVDVSIGGPDIPAGYDIGFVFEQVGLLGLIGLDVLGGVTIATYNNNVPQESFVANSNLANVGLLGSGQYAISFKTNLSFDRVRITVSSALSLLTTYRIYYGFIRPDGDGDGFADCVDRCPGGDDNFDEDGDGVPDTCDTPLCDLDGGLDVNVCPGAGTASLPAAGPGQSWAALAGNPSAATIDNNGMIMGLSLEGSYLFVLNEGLCSDTVALNYLSSLNTSSCNDPIAAAGAIIDNNVACVLCSLPSAANVIDGDLSNFVSYGSLLNLSLLGVQTPLIAVKDTLRSYPAGTRVGYAVSFPNGILSLGLLDAFVLRTYRNNVLVETATLGGGTLGVDALGFSEGIQRLFFEATQEFDELELVVAGGLVSLDLLTSINIYYAFVEDALTCPSGNTNGVGASDCSIGLLSNTELCGMLNYDHTGIVGIACVGCQLDSLSHLVDDDLSNYATLSLTVGAVGSANIALVTPKVIPAGSEAGFGVSLGGSLLSLDLLDNLTITTYLGGVQQEQFSASSPLLSVSLLGGGSELSLLGFTSTQAFDEIQLSVDALAGVSLLGGVMRVYYAYFSTDSDGDGTPDCLDRCCSGSDFLDMDGDGMPDVCDVFIDAMEDTVSTSEDNPVNIDVLANDDFGGNGPGATAIQLVDPPSNGTAVVLDNGTPNDPTDDFISYTPGLNYVGSDTLSYLICDANFSCDTAIVIITMLADTIRLSPIMLLQGALLGSGSGLMRDDLRIQSRIPHTEPYSALSAFTHVGGGGGETITNPSLVLADHGNNAIVDWVFVELRNPADSTQVVATRAGLLQRDGDVVEVDGVSPLSFVGSDPATYFISVRHRNHLGAMTQQRILMPGATVVVDFTDLGIALWDDGTNLDGYEQATVAGKFALWLGNGNTDDKTVFAGQTNDVQSIFNEVDGAPANFLNSQTYIFNGYHAGDINLSSAAIYAGQNTDVDFIFNNVDGHPRNLLRSQTFIIREQLPQP